MKPTQSGIKILLENKKAHFNYTLEERLECGVVLLGTEVKSIKAKAFNFNDSYVSLRKGKLVLEKLHISPYSHGNLNNHAPERGRLLLAHAREIEKLDRTIKQKSLTLVPVRIYLKSGLIKVEIALARGKKLHDKRETIKAKDLARETNKMLKGKFS
jgi:SsrA-binding protein